MCPGRVIAIITWVGSRPELKSLVLNSHTDVVPVYEVTHQSLYRSHRMGQILLKTPVSVCFRNTGNMIHLLLLKMSMATSMAEDLRI